MNTSKLNDTLNLLRTSYKDGKSLMDRISQNTEEDFRSIYGLWNTKTENFFRYLFYNQDFLESYKNLNEYSEGFNGDGQLEMEATLGNKLGFIESHGQLLKLGYLKDQGVGIDNSSSKMAFIAMWFSKETNDTYSLGIKPAVEENIYEAMRIDKLEHNEKIDEKILEKIRDSKFLIADYTGHRGGVYFEAGYAKGLGLPVIPICKKGHESDLHFDVKMYNTIIYSNITELKTRLQERIKETIGIFRNVPNVNSVNSFGSDIPF